MQISKEMIFGIMFSVLMSVQPMVLQIFHLPNQVSSSFVNCNRPSDSFNLAMINPVNAPKEPSECILPANATKI